jgi:ABC-type antimicrobial peptide transport system permease subunit
MFEALQPRQRPKQGFSTSAIATLAFWQLRRTWFLLFFITLGMVAAVVIACAIPLLSNVMTTAGLRSTLRATPDIADIALNTGVDGISTPIVQNVYHQFDPLFHHYLGNTIQPDQFAITSEDFSLYPSRKNAVVTVYGTSMQQAAPHLGLIQGQLARITSNPSSVIQTMMTPDTAQLLGVKVGSTFKLSLNYLVETSTTVFQHSAVLTIRVAGLFSLTPADAAYWHGEDFKTMKFSLEKSTGLSQYTLLFPEDALLALFDQLRSSYHTDAIHSLNADGYSLIWHYHLDSSQLDVSKLDSLINQLAGVQAAIDSQYGDLENGASPVTNPSYPYLMRVEFTGQTFSFNGNPSVLEEFRSRIAVARIPTGVFSILILSLILFFVSLMTTLLVDRQRETIALLQSRGASRRQIIGALLVQTIGVGIIALLIGLPLAAFTVLLLSQRVLPIPERDALNIMTDHPLQAIAGTIWYALSVILVALFTMSISLFYTARMDILALRRETARSNKLPLWQRLNLDVIAGVIALAGYGFSLYVTSIGTVLQGDAQVLIATPLTIIAPLFLIIGCLFLFLRIFPLLLLLGARVATRGRGAVAMLAFAQTARSPRQSLRKVMLLALATAFTLFTLVFLATQSQHIQEIVNYQTGADFSAELLSNGASSAQINRQYQSIPGVLSVCVGFTGQGYGGTASLPLDFRAVDASSFGQTVIWPSQASFQAASPLLARLVSLRQLSSTSDVVPAIVDQTIIDKSLLHVGSSFTVTLSNIYPATMQFFVIGVVNHIPTINTLLVTDNGKLSTVTGGVLVDYQTFLNAFRQNVKKAGKLIAQPSPPVINQIWLHTKGDAASLGGVRAALDNPKYSFSHLEDRRLLLDTLLSDPLYLVLYGVLILGTATAFLVTLVGDVLASWISVRTRQISFITLRALGTTLRQTAGVLAWEQAIVYLTGVLLGVGFGILLIVSVIPALTFTDLNSNLSNEQFFALQSALSTQIAVPPSLPLILFVLVCIYGIALTIMVRVVSRPLIGQKLRLDEG